MFWKNIYDIIHPRSTTSKYSQWFDFECEFQTGCAEHDMNARCIRGDIEGATDTYYYRCIRPYLWDPENLQQD